jgi:hypothetical protein
MATIFGRFYFKRTASKNLVGEFSNDKSGIHTESADLVGNAGNDYFGDYYSTWQDSSSRSLHADLNISPKPGFPGVYKLEWKRSRAIIFTGEGMLCDDILIGNYQD